MWNLNVLSWIKIFPWKFLWGRLPTSDWLCNVLHCFLNPCPICQLKYDTIKHIFFKYHFAPRYWDLFQTLTCYQFQHFSTCSSGSWVDLEKSSSNHLKSLIATSFWMLCKNKNEILFSNCHSSPLNIWCRVQAKISKQKMGSKPPEDLWAPPNNLPISLIHCYILETDESCSPNFDLAGTGYPVSFVAGNNLAARYNTTHLAHNALQAECCAVSDHLHNILIKMDSLQLVNIFEGAKTLSGGWKINVKK